MLTKLALVACSALFATATAQTNASARHLAEGLCWQVQLDVDLIDRTYGAVREKEPEGCPARCEKSERCGLVTWTDHDGGYCWLKADGEPTEPIRGAVVPGAVSLIWSAHCQRNDVPLGKCDMTGKYDVGSETAAAAVKCYDICDAMTGCSAFTWTPFNGGTCWLKSRVSECRPSDTAESGVIFTRE